jgi:AcrR family transcriptional regulator
MPTVSESRLASEPRRPRRDAVRNRERLLQAAREEFAEHGLDVPLEDVARRAGVGIATLYRHFPSRDALVDAIVDERLERFAGLIEDALEEEDAWHGFATFLARGLDTNARDRALADTLARSARDRRSRREAKGRIAALLEELIGRAQAQGGLRPDVGLSDVIMLFWAHGRIAEMTAPVARDACRRHLALVLDALAAPGSTPLPGAPLTREQLRRASRRRRS